MHMKCQSNSQIYKCGHTWAQITEISQSPDADPPQNRPFKTQQQPLVSLASHLTGMRKKHAFYFMLDLSLKKGPCWGDSNFWERNIAGLRLWRKWPLPAWLMINESSSEKTGNKCFRKYCFTELNGLTSEMIVIYEQRAGQMTQHIIFCIFHATG